MALKILFKIDTRKITQKRSCTKLLKDWIDRERMEKQIVVKNEDTMDKNEDFPSFINL